MIIIISYSYLITTTKYYLSKHIQHVKKSIKKESSENIIIPLLYKEKKLFAPTFFAH